MAELCYTATWPALKPSQQSVAAWLVSHHERAGLAGYFQATSTTVTITFTGCGQYSVSKSAA